MPITNFNFPRVTVTQQFSALSSTASPVLPVCVIGPQYRVYDYATDADRLPRATLTLSNKLLLVPGSPLVPADVSTVVLYMKDAKAALTSAALTVTPSTDKMSLTLDILLGSFVGLTRNASIILDDVQVGDTVQLTAAGADPVLAAVIQVSSQVMYLSPLLGTLTAAHTTLAAIYRTVSTRISAPVSNGAINVSDPTVQITSTTGSLLTLNLVSCDTVYIEYKQGVTTYTHSLGVVYSGGDAALACALLFGNCTTLNPLGLAVLMATQAAGDGLVYFMGIDPAIQDTELLAAAYKQALDFLGKDDTVYSIVPCTYEPAVLSAIMTLINEQSDLLVPNYKILWYAALNSLLSSALAVQSILDQKLISSRRAAMVFADDAVFNGLIVPNWAVAAAAAGMRSKELPHRPLSNMPYSFFTVKLTHGFTAQQLRLLGANGIWLVANNSLGIPINKRQLTTAAADDINYDEQSLTTNIDSICKRLKRIGADMVGNSNISAGLISLLSILCNTLLLSYTQTKLSALVGPQLLSVDLVELRQDPVILDRVYAHIKGQPPKPFNLFDITFTMV